MAGIAEAPVLSQSARTQTAFDAAALVLTSEVTVRVRASVDAVAWFAGFDANAQRRYWDTDLDDYLEDPWQRPLAYLDHVTEDAAGDVMVPIFQPQGRSSAETDMPDGARVTQRRGKYSDRDRAWTEDDFETLAAAVPWLRPVVGDDGELLPPETMNVPFDGFELP